MLVQQAEDPWAISVYKILRHSQWESQSEYGTAPLYFVSKDSLAKSINKVFARCKT